MCNCFGQETENTSSQADQRITWSDNLAIAAQPSFYKTPIFGSSDAARDSPEAHHMGGVLKWRMISDEPAFSTYSIFLLSPSLCKLTSLSPTVVSRPSIHSVVLQVQLHFYATAQTTSLIRT
jgi:hypothetical protein